MCGESADPARTVQSAEATGAGVGVQNSASSRLDLLARETVGTSARGSAA